MNNNNEWFVRIATEKTISFLIEVFSRLEGLAQKAQKTTTTTMLAMLTPQYFAGLSRDFVEKSPFFNKAHYSLLKKLQKTAVSLFLGSIFSEIEEKNLRFDVTEESLGFLTQNTGFFSKAIALLMKTEAFNVPGPHLTLEISDFPRFLLIFRSLVRECENLARIFTVFEEKIEDFLEENPDFFDGKSPALSELYSIFKPAIVEKNPEKNRLETLSAMVLGENPFNEPHSKLAVLEDFLRRSDDLFLINLLPLASLVPFIDLCLTILLQNPAVHPDTDDLLNRLMKPFAMFSRRARQTPAVFQRSENLLIELLVPRFLQNMRKMEEKLPVFEKNLGVYRETLSESQFEGFSVRVLEHLAENGGSNDQVS